MSEYNTHALMGVARLVAIVKKERRTPECNANPAQGLFGSLGRSIDYDSPSPCARNACTDKVGGALPHFFPSRLVNPRLRVSHKLTKVVYLGCYGRRGPRVTQFGRVALWALERTPYQVKHLRKRTLLTARIGSNKAEASRGLDGKLHTWGSSMDRF